ncbi:MAG: signal recognition particle protein, partial [Chloroflexi bacterium]|nr:signal recognition particle protein [Chloroflexota bacterium]
MLFESLSERLQGIFKKLRGKGVLTEKDVDEALREVRLALLEADVNFRVVKEFLGRVRERAVGAEVRQSLTPAQQVIKIVNEELIATLGGGQAKINLDGQPAVVMLVGLQG